MASSREFDLIRTINYLWEKRALFVFVTGIIVFLATVYAAFSRPVYYAQAVITSKVKGDGFGAPAILSQLSGRGQEGVGPLSKLDIIVNSQALAESVVAKANLLPLLYPSRWDSVSSTWKRGVFYRKEPTIQLGAQRLRSQVLQADIDMAKGTLAVGVRFADPGEAKRIANVYVEELNKWVVQDVMRSAEIERQYLENQLDRAIDPILREKISSIIAQQIEKAMTVSSQAIDVLEHPYIPIEPIAPKRIKLMVLSLFGGSVVAIFLILFVRAGKEFISMLKKDRDVMKIDRRI